MNGNSIKNGTIHLTGDDPLRTSDSVHASVDRIGEVLHASPPRPADPDQARAAAEASEGDPDKEWLEKKAAMLRARLAETLESLYQRKESAVRATRKVVETTREVRKRSLPAAVATAGALVLVAGGTGYLVHRSRSSWKQRLAARLNALTRLWKHPERVAAPKPRSMGSEVVRGAVVSIGAFLLTEIAKMGIARLLPKLEKKLDERMHKSDLDAPLHAPLRAPIDLPATDLPATPVNSTSKL